MTATCCAGNFNVFIRMSVIVLSGRQRSGGHSCLTLSALCGGRRQVATLTCILPVTTMRPRTNSATQWTSDLYSYAEQPNSNLLCCICQYVGSYERRKSPVLTSSGIPSSSQRPHAPAHTLSVASAYYMPYKPLRVVPSIARHCAQKTLSRLPRSSEMCVAWKDTSYTSLMRV